MEIGGSNRNGVNLLDHPVFELLPKRTQTKLASPVSEDRLSWDCFYELHRAGILADILGRMLNIEIEDEPTPKLILWGFLIDEDSSAGYPATPVETRPKTADQWSPLLSILKEIENYNDGKREGQKTEPDVMVLAKGTLILLECKRNHGLGRCSRFENQECPEIHTKRRKREYCQYWERGLPSLVKFARPNPAAPSAPECNEFYQLMRNYMIGTRLAHSLGCKFHPLVVKDRNSQCFDETEREVVAFNGTLRSTAAYKLVSWTAIRDNAKEFGVELLRSYKLD